MKRLVTLLALAAVCLMAVQPVQAKAKKEKVLFYVYMHCDACVQKIMKNIAFEKGVKDIICSIENQTVEVTYDANKTDIPTLQKAFDKIGKPASLTPDAQQVSHDGEEEHHHHHHH